MACYNALVSDMFWNILLLSVDDLYKLYVTKITKISNIYQLVSLQLHACWEYFGLNFAMELSCIGLTFRTMVYCRVVSAGCLSNFGNSNLTNLICKLNRLQNIFLNRVYMKWVYLFSYISLPKYFSLFHFDVHPSNSFKVDFKYFFKYFFKLTFLYYPFR